MNQKFANFIRPFSHEKLAIAVSGGVDSTALLHMAAKMNVDMVALHVNHGLRAAAGADAQFVRNACEKLGVPCYILEWAGTKPTAGIEAAARTARYKLMTDFCHSHGIKTLVIAHQADDQIETFLLNLARGSGIYGLGGMRRVSMRHGVRVVRPLLDVSRDELVQYCQTHDVEYIHDEMNDDLNYARVRMRARRRILNDQLGISDSRILLAMRNLDRTRCALDEYIAGRMATLGADLRRVVFMESFLFDEATDIGLKLLGNLIQQVGGNEYPPRLKSLERAMDFLRQDCKFTLGGCTLRRFNNRILIVPEGCSTSLRKENEKSKKNH